MGIIQDLRDEKAIVLFHDYRNNQAIDEANYEPDIVDNDGTLTDTVWNGRGITFPENTSVVSAAHDDRMEIDEGCLVFFTNERFSSQTSTEYLIQHTSGAPDGFIAYLYADNIGILNMGAPQALATSVINKKTIGINFSDGSASEGFLDGATAGNFSSTASVTKATSGTLYIGNDGASYPLQSSLQAAILINRELTADEHSDLHDELVDRFAETRWTDAQDRLLSQFEDSPNVKALVEVIFNRIDNVDYVLRYLEDYTGINTACGVWLDVVGDIVGIPRPHVEQSYGTMFAFKERADVGTAWQTESSAADLLWLAVTHSDELDMYAAVASSGTGNRVMTSPDGITWTSRTSAADNNWRGITYGNGLFVAVADSGANRVQTSPDGITWTARVCPATAWAAVVWSEEVGTFSAVGYTAGVGNQAMTSPDGITWTARNSAADRTWLSVCWSAEVGLFAAAAITGTGDRIMTSPDGITWTSRTSAADNNWRGIAYGSDLFVAVSNSGTGDRVMTSPDGVTWTSRENSDDSNWRDVCYGDGRFIAVADNSGTAVVVMTSYNGVDWTSWSVTDSHAWRHVCYGGEQAIAVGISGAGELVMRSAPSMFIDDPYKAFV